MPIYPGAFRFVGPFTLLVILRISCYYFLVSMPLSFAMCLKAFLFLIVMTQFTWADVTDPFTNGAL